MIAPPAPVHDDAIFRAAVRQSPDAIVFADRHGVIRLWNDAATRLFGFAAADAVGASLDLVIPERFRAAHWAGFHRALDAGTTRYAGTVMTTRGTHADGRKLYVDLAFGIVNDEHGAVVGVVATARSSAPRPTA